MVHDLAAVADATTECACERFETVDGGDGSIGGTKAGKLSMIERRIKPTNILEPEVANLNLLSNEVEQHVLSGGAGAGFVSGLERVFAHYCPFEQESIFLSMTRIGPILGQAQERS